MAMIHYVDPAGNMTAIVRGEFGNEKRVELAKQILQQEKAEQVGFEVPPVNGGDCRLEMMGGEFCGNAVRAFAYLKASEQHSGGRHAVKAVSYTHLDVYKRQTGEILILGYTHPRQFSLLRHFHLTQTVLDHDYAELLNRSGRKIDVHIKIDTGMHRLGERCEHIDHLKKIFSCDNLRITGAYTHLCTSDKSSPREEAFVSVQTQAFYEAIAKLREQGCVCPKVHVLASYGLVNYPEIGGDYARIGIALYGMLSTREDTEECARKTGLRPVLSLKARIISVKDVFAEESAGYGLQFTAQRDGKIAVAAVGYADGLPRSLSCGAGEVLIRCV